MAEKKLIGVYLAEANKDNKWHPTLKKSFCSLDSTKKCPYLARGECIRPLILVFGAKCPYISSSDLRGPSRRAKSYYNFLSDARDEVNAGPKMPNAYGKKHVSEIGDYIFFPYSYATVCKEVPFLSHSGFMVSGTPFLKKEHFTPEAIVTLTKFVPRTQLTFEEIREYQRDIVPLFLFHLKYMMPGLYNKATKLDNTIKEKTPSLDTVKKVNVTLTIIPKDIIDGYTVGKSFVPLSWDGEWIEIAGDPGFTVLSGYKGTDFRTKFKPDKKGTKVVITDTALIKKIIKKCVRFIDKESFEN
jgi:hypothetical protein